MSKLSYRSAAEAACVRDLMERGWERGWRNGMNHLVMRWPATGATLLVPGSGPRHFYVKVHKTARGKEAPP